MVGHFAGLLNYFTRIALFVHLGGLLLSVNECLLSCNIYFSCLIFVFHQGLHAINLGDSGFIVVRNGSTIFRSPVQQHGFNFTYQLESGNGGDLPSSGEVSKCAQLPLIIMRF